MRIDILTLFPGMFNGPFEESILSRAQEQALLDIHLWDIRSFTTDRHHTADDTPYGGGAGMVMKPEPIFRAVDRVRVDGPADVTPRILLLSPQGQSFRQEIAENMAAEPWLILICGHYEGVDERVRSLVDGEISIGDYVLTGGELAAMVLVDAVARLIPGVLGGAESVEEESFSWGILEYPQYTRPREYRGMEVPEVLLRGDHGAITKWRRKHALIRTAQRRPDLFEKVSLTPDERALIERYRKLSSDPGSEGDD